MNAQKMQRGVDQHAAEHAPARAAPAPLAAADSKGVLRSALGQLLADMRRDRPLR